MALISVPPVWTTASHSDMRLLALNHFSEEDAIVKKFMWRHSEREKFKKSKKNIRERWGMLYLCGSGVCVRGFHFCKPPPCKEKTKQDVKHVTHLRSFKFTHEDFPPSPSGHFLGTPTEHFSDQWPVHPVVSNNEPRSVLVLLSYLTCIPAWRYCWQNQKCVTAALFTHYIKTSCTHTYKHNSKLAAFRHKLSTNLKTAALFTPSSVY